MGEQKVPLLDLTAQAQSLGTELQDAVQGILASNAFCLGPEVAAFEKEFAEFCAIPHAVGVNSGTSALHLAMRVLDIGPGDEVITTAMTFAATCWAISYVGATPVFVDIEPRTMNIDPAGVKSAITDRTKAVLAVHLHGLPCDLRALSAVCAEAGVTLIEDAAQAHGAEYDSRPMGAFGRLAAFSFYPGKNLGACGEGGMLITDDATLYERAVRLRNHGSEDRYHHLEVGYNYRMEGIQAAALRVKLRRLRDWNERRRRWAGLYDELLADTPLPLPFVPEKAVPVYHHYAVLCPDRNGMCEFLTERGVGWGLHYPVPMHLQPCYGSLGYKQGDLPNAEQNAEQTLSLPIFPEMTEEQVRYVAEGVKGFFGS